MIEWLLSAQRDLDGLSIEIRRRLLRRIFALLQNHFPGSSKPLSGVKKGERSLRVGDYRVIYRVRNGGILVIAVGHRREIYDVWKNRLSSY